MYQPKTLRSKLIIASTFALISASAGFTLHDPLIKAKTALTDIFATKPYIAPLSEYEQRTQDLFNSKQHQATCLAQAKATVSLELVQKYLNETKKQQLIATYAIPESLVNDINAGEQARKSNTTNKDARDTFVPTQNTTNKKK